MSFDINGNGIMIYQRFRLMHDVDQNARRARTIYQIST